MKEKGNPSSDIILYNSPQGNVKIEVIYSGETFWLTQKRLAELFGVAVPAISLPAGQAGKHLKNISACSADRFETGELQEDSVISKMETTVRKIRTVQFQLSGISGILHWMVKI
jgi:hypothetical protein